MSCEDDVLVIVDEELEYKETYYLPILYSIDKSGKERLWKIWVIGDTVHRIQGLVNGKKQTYQRTFKGKNIGKKNETTPCNQAKQESETMWTKQIDKGYYPKCKEGKTLLSKIKKSTLATGGHNINAAAVIGGRKEKKVKKTTEKLIVSKVDVNIKPMKAGIWEHTPGIPRNVLPKTLKYFSKDNGFYMQYKLDGWRCIARLQTLEESLEVRPEDRLEDRPEDEIKKGESEHSSTKSKNNNNYAVVLTTNNQKQFPWFKSLREELLRFILDKAKELHVDPTSLIFDGELYSHVLYDENGVILNNESRFSTISSMCGLARTSPHPLEDQICYFIFDLVDLYGEDSQTTRFDELKEMFFNEDEDNNKVDHRTPHIIMCNTEIGYTPEDVINYHDKASQKGYEGVIIRSRQLKYIQKRSLYMRKYKYFIDREYPIIGIHKDEGVGDEYFAWVCCDPDIIDPSTKKALEFRATPKADRQTKKEWCENYLEYIGKSACVRFQEYSNDRVPRFPVMVGIREDQ